MPKISELTAATAITVSQALYDQMRALDPVGMTRRPFGAEPLRRVIPPVGMLDLTPLIATILLFMIARQLTSF